MKITITRLRSGANYKGTPLLDIMDSFYELYWQFIQDHSEFEYGVCNFGWNKANRRTLDDVVDADVLLIPSEQEFQWHIKGYRDQREKLRTDDFVSRIGQTLETKHVILFRSDRADNESLYREKVFPGLSIGKLSILDEMDIEGGIHGMKHHFIREVFKPRKKKFDFIYWGCDKRKNSDNETSGDERHEVFKRLQRDGIISTYFIGKYSTVKANERVQTMRDLVPTLSTGRSTLCFNWMDSTATTSRYHEAIACEVFPFVWKDYDSTNTIVVSEWQRVHSVDELYEKMPNVEKMFPKVKQHYLRNTLKDKDWYYEKFEKRLLAILRDKSTGKRVRRDGMSEIVEVPKQNLPTQALHDALSEIADSMKRVVNATIETAIIIAKHEGRDYWRDLEDALLHKVQWFDPSTLSMFRKVGNNVAMRDKQNWDKLPPSYNTLYHLSFSEPERLTTAINAGKITPRTTLKQAREFSSKDKKTRQTKKTVETDSFTITATIRFSERTGKVRLAKNLLAKLQMDIEKNGGSIHWEES